MLESKLTLPLSSPPSPSEDEAGRMLESIQDLFLQREKADTVSFERKSSDDAIFKKPKPFARRLSKKDISAPCNFKHVSGMCLYMYVLCLFVCMCVYMYTYTYTYVCVQHIL